MELIEVLKKTFKKLTLRSVLVSIILIGVAILLITNPEKVLSIAVIITGIALAINGIIRFVIYMGQSPEIRAISSDFLIAIIECVVGTIFIADQEKIISIFYIIVGMWLIIESIQKLQMALNLKNYISNGFITVIVSFIDLALGLLVIMHPYDAGTSITQVTGIILAVSEGFNLIESIYTYFRVRKIGTEVEKTIVIEKDNNE